MILQCHSSLSSGTVIGVFFSAMVAFGLAIVSRDLFPGPRTRKCFSMRVSSAISDNQILSLMLLFLVLMTFQAVSYNHLLYIGLNPALSPGASRVRVAIQQSILRRPALTLVVMFSVQAVGVLLVTAMPTSCRRRRLATWPDRRAPCSGGRCWSASVRLWPASSSPPRTGHGPQPVPPLSLPAAGFFSARSLPPCAGNRRPELQSGCVRCVLASKMLSALHG